MAGYRIISSDDHVFEPRELWTSRVEPRYRNRAPHIVRHDDGGDWWYTDGVRGQGHFGGGSQAGARFYDPSQLTPSATFEDVRPGGIRPSRTCKGHGPGWGRRQRSISHSGPSTLLYRA